MSTDELSIRLATLSDKDDVIDINRNVYDGVDYLDAYYEDFISSPVTTPYVAILDSKIVGFVATIVVDGGETVVTRAARIHSSVSGRGLYKMLEAHALSLSKIHRRAFTTADSNPETSKESFNAVNKLIVTRPFAEFLFDASNMQSLQEEHDKPTVVPTDEELEAFLSNDLIRTFLFPKDRIVVDWVPHRAISAYIPLFRWAPNRMKMLSDVSLSEEQKVNGLLTICTTFKSKDPPYSNNFDIYGTDVSSLRSHVVYHLRHIQKETEGDVGLLVFVHDEFDMTELENVFYSVGVKRNDCDLSTEPEHKYTKQVLYEKLLA